MDEEISPKKPENLPYLNFFSHLAAMKRIMCVIPVFWGEKKIVLLENSYL